MRALRSALCSYELPALHGEAAYPPGLVPTRVNDAAALYAEPKPGIAGIPELTDAFGISHPSPPNRIEVLKRLHKALPARRSCVEQAKRCLRTHPYLDSPHVGLRDAGMAPSSALRTLGPRTAAGKD